ncbi:hypothetical protein [Carboxylicivirga marina]|uniref:hypothetical protein n=1 Tax=Carboxylicivirga marina TaxID=2800988 RepID=UPI0025917784|nr:hypothetical protein [uncultured Carboxylicivirga sp.]
MLSSTSKTFLFICTLLLLSCDPTTYITQKNHFKYSYSVNEVNTPDFPFSDTKEQNPVKISFPKQNAFSLHLSTHSCGGAYSADLDGTINFTNTNCSSNCCETDWDYYMITLIKKVSHYEGDPESTSLILFINNTNYLVLELDEQYRTKQSS